MNKPLGLWLPSDIYWTWITSTRAVGLRAGQHSRETTSLTDRPEKVHPAPRLLNTNCPFPLFSQAHNTPQLSLPKVTMVQSPELEGRLCDFLPADAGKSGSHSESVSSRVMGIKPYRSHENTRPTWQVTRGSGASQTHPAPTLDSPLPAWLGDTHFL